MNDAFIVDAARTPIGSFCSAFAKLGPAELAQTPLSAIISRNGLPSDSVDEVILGCVLAAGHGQNVARQAAIRCGIAKEKTALTVNMVCGSGLRAVALAAQAIRAGDAELIAAGGTESMSQAAYLIKNARAGLKMGNSEITDSMISDGLWDVFGNYHMGITAEALAEKYHITRAEQDAFAALSQAKAEKAIADGKFKDEITPVPVPQPKAEPVLVDKDEYPRPGTTVEKLAKLRPAFKKDGTVTAGNSSGINDGAACLLVASEAAVKKHGLKPMARIVSCAWAGVDPAIMGIGPAEAVRKALKKAGWKLSDAELIEGNEAFASQALAVGKELGFDPALLNVNGGAIALGHPIGASGARILVTLLYEMKKRSAKKGLATLCIGGGMGIAACVETA